jgi:hypothetical protein
MNFYVSLSKEVDLSYDTYDDGGTKLPFDIWMDRQRSKYGKNGYLCHGKLVSTIEEAEKFDSEDEAEIAINKSRFRYWEGVINPV